MKKILITLTILLVLIVSALFAAPMFFKAEILQFIQSQVSHNIKGKLKIGDMNLSMFESFPDLNVALDDILIITDKSGVSDTVVKIPNFEASVNFKTLLTDDDIIINRIHLEDCRLQASIDTSGDANWGIFVTEEKTGEKTGTTTTVEDPKDEKVKKGLRFNDISIENLSIDYKDYNNSTYASILDIDLELSGNLSTENSVVQVMLSLDNISFRQQNNVWVNNIDMNWEADIAANFIEKKFKLKKNKLSINELKLDLIGNIAFVEDICKLDIQLNAPDSKFESLLALVPKHLQHHIEEIETSGDFKLNASIKGEYYENHLPSFQAHLKVNNAHLKYPKLPEAINKVNIDLSINNPGGSSDSTNINLKEASFNMGGNPFNLFLNISNPNDPLLDGGANGVINFESIKRAIPLKDVTLRGVVTTDITFKGKYQYIEKEEYEKFIAKGNVLFNNILFVNDAFPKGVFIPQGNVTITPSHLRLNKLQAKIYSSDFLVQGNITNYLPYFFKDGVLKGDFSLTSKQINVNEFIVAQQAKQNSGKKQQKGLMTAHIANPSTVEGTLEIPKNIDIKLTTNIGAILFDRLLIRNIKGDVNIARAVANLRQLRMEMLDGSMVVNGHYNTVNPKTPKIDFDLQVSNFDINKAYQSFTFIRKSMPIAMDCNGKVSAAMNFATTLDKEMSPIMKTANGSGYLSSKGFLINNNRAMNQLASVLKNDELSRLSISQLKINFKLKNGNIVVEPFNTSFAGNPVRIYGQQSVDGQLDYTLSMNVNRKFFGNDINKMLKSIPGSNNITSLDLDAKIGGTLNKPIVTPDLSKAIKTVTKEAAKELKGNVLDGLRKLFK